MNATANAKLDQLTPQLWFALGIADKLHRVLANEPLTITSANDGEHMQGSLHFKNDAVDIRTRDLTVLQKTNFYTTLAQALSPLGFDVVFESDHLHIEWDPKATSPPWVTRVS